MQSNHSAPSRQTVRLFVGIRPDATTQQFLDETVSHFQQLEMPPNTRWSTRNNRHLTLVFLGDTPTDQLGKIELALQRIGKSTVAFCGQITRVHPFPKTHSKILAAELPSNPELDNLQRQCRELTASLGKTPETIRYRPHFTLARNPSGLLRSHSLKVDHNAALDNLILYQSQLTPNGSEYTPIFEMKLL